jgi:hypothetical protein
VEARVVHGNNSVAAHRDDPGGAIRQALENDRAEGAAGVLRSGV